jgi:hypothetical protein
VRSVTAAGLGDARGAARLALVAALLAGAVVLGALAALYLHGPGRARLFPLPATVPATPTPPTLDVTREALTGVWVGSLEGVSLVVSVVPGALSEDRVECALNAGTREVIAFEAIVERGRGLSARALPGFDVRFGAAHEDARGRLVIPLVDEEGRVRARLSKTESSALEVER